jgi:endonuclease YncB( thermonuclease family)
MRRVADGLIALIVVALVIAAAYQARERDRLVFERVDIAVDGDTLALAGERLRLEGVDAPELDQTCGAAGQIPCGRQARAALARLIAPGVRCAASRRDRYDRPLVRCATGAGEDVAGRLVWLGHALSDGCCRAEEAAARAASRGLWAAPFQRPADWRRERRPAI